MKTITNKKFLIITAVIFALAILVIPWDKALALTTYDTSDYGTYLVKDEGTYLSRDWKPTYKQVYKEGEDSVVEMRILMSHLQWNGVQCAWFSNTACFSDCTVGVEISFIKDDKTYAKYYDTTWCLLQQTHTMGYYVSDCTYYADNNPANRELITDARGFLDKGGIIKITKVTIQE